MSIKSRPVHFLLVEDDDSHVELIQLALADNRVANTMHRVADGIEAMRYLHSEGEHSERMLPDVVLLDLKLPRMDGLEVLSAIKRDPVLHTLPVVVLTTSSAEADRAKAYEFHANSYVVKPLDFNQFHRMVKELHLYWSAWNEPPPVSVLPRTGKPVL